MAMTESNPTEAFVASLDAPPPPTGKPDRYPTLFALMREHGIEPTRVLEAGFGIDGYRYGELIDSNRGSTTDNRLMVRFPKDGGWAYREMQWPSPEIGTAMMAAYEVDLNMRAATQDWKDSVKS